MGSSGEYRAAYIRATNTRMVDTRSRNTHVVATAPCDEYPRSGHRATKTRVVVIRATNTRVVTPVRRIDLPGNRGQASNGIGSLPISCR
jgi:hypothetical protein